MAPRSTGSPQLLRHRRSFVGTKVARTTSTWFCSRRGNNDRNYHVESVKLSDTNERTRTNKYQRSGRRRRCLTHHDEAYCSRRRARSVFGRCRFRTSCRSFPHEWNHGTSGQLRVCERRALGDWAIVPGVFLRRLEPLGGKLSGAPARGGRGHASHFPHLSMLSREAASRQVLELASMPQSPGASLPNFRSGSPLRKPGREVCVIVAIRRWDDDASLSFQHRGRAGGFSERARRGTAPRGR